MSLLDPLSNWLSLPRPLADSGYVVLDLEATSLDVDTAAVIQCALLRVPPGGRSIDGEWTWWLTRPGEPLSAETRALLRIEPDSPVDRALAAAPRFADVIADIAALCGDLPLIAHNATGYDGPLLRRAIECAGVDWRPRMLDSLWLGPLAFPGLGSYALANLAHTLGLDGDRDQDLAHLFARAATPPLTPQPAPADLPAPTAFHDARYDAAVLAVAVERMRHALANLATDQRDHLARLLPECARLFGATRDQQQRLAPVTPDETTTPWRPPADDPVLVLREAVEIVDAASSSGTVSPVGSTQLLSAKKTSPHTATEAFNRDRASETWRRAGQERIVARTLEVLGTPHSRAVLAAPVEVGRSVALAAAAVEHARREHVAGRRARVLIAAGVPRRRARYVDLLARLGSECRVVVWPPRNQQVCGARLDAVTSTLTADSPWPLRYGVAVVERWYASTQTGDAGEIGRWVRRALPEVDRLLDEIAPPATAVLDSDSAACLRECLAMSPSTSRCALRDIASRVVDADMVVTDTSTWLDDVGGAALAAFTHVIVDSGPVSPEVPAGSDAEGTIDPRDDLVERVRAWLARAQARGDEVRLVIAAPVPEVFGLPKTGTESRVAALARAELVTPAVADVDAMLLGSTEAELPESLAEIVCSLWARLPVEKRVLLLAASRGLAVDVAARARARGVATLLEGEQAWPRIERAAHELSGVLVCGYRRAWDGYGLGRMRVVVVAETPLHFDRLVACSLARAHLHATDATRDVDRGGVPPLLIVADAAVARDLAAEPRAGFRPIAVESLGSIMERVGGTGSNERANAAGGSGDVGE